MTTGAEPLATVMDHALRLVATVERQSRILRGLDAPLHRLVGGGRLAFHHDVDPADVPFTLKRPLDESGPGRWEAVRADVVLVARNPTRRIRVRALYLRAGLAVALHGRLPFRPVVRLLHGADVARRLWGGTDRAMEIPEELERGRRLRHAWVVETLLPGTQVRPDQWEAISGRLADGVVDLWRQEPITIHPFRDAVARIDADSFQSMVDDLGLTTKCPGELAGVVAAVTGSRAGVLVGATHGDVVPGNVLHLPDRRLGLVDWEKAAVGPLGIDAARMAIHVDDPAALVRRIERRLPPINHQGVAPWAHQVGGVLASLVPLWHSQMRLWPGRRKDGQRARLSRRLRVAERLLIGH